jgi:hypothetical protein
MHQDTINLFYACGDGDIAVARAAVAAGVAADSVDLKWLLNGQASSRFTLACDNGHLAIVQWIVEQDSELVALCTDKQGCMPGMKIPRPCGSLSSAATRLWCTTSTPRLTT